MFKRKSSYVIIASILAFACTLIGTVGLFSTKTHAESEWSGTYTVTNEDGAVVYTANSCDVDLLEYHGAESAATANKFTFSYRPNADYTTDVAYVGFYIKQPNGNQLLFDIMNHWKLYRLIRWNPGEAWLSEKRIMPEENYTAGWIGYDKWYDVEIIFTPNYVKLTVDGFMVAETFDHGIILDQASLGIASWGCAPSVKDMQFSKVDVDGKWSGSYTATTENNETVYTANDVWSVNRLLYSGEVDSKANNTIRFAFRPNEAWSGADTTNFSFVITAANGQSIWLYFMNYWKVLRVIHYGAQESWLSEVRYIPEENYAPGWNGYDSWYNVEVLFNGSFLSLSVNGIEVVSPVALPISLNGASYLISTWGAQHSVKGMEFAYTVFDSDWIATNHVTTKENGEDVYTAKTQDSSSIEYHGLETSATVNKISYSFRPNAGYSTDLADVGFYIKQSNGNLLAFTLMNHWKLLRVRRWNPNEAWLNEARYMPEENYTAGWNGYDKWYKVEIIFTERYLSITVDGYLVAETFDHGMDLSQSTFGISSWACAPSIKGMEFSKVEVADSWGGSYTKGVENEETVYTANSGDVSVLRFNKGVDTSKVNTIKYSFRPNETYSGYDTSHSTFNIIAADGQQLSFTFMNHWKVLRVIHYGAQESWLREVRYIPEENYTAGWNAYDVWYNVEIIFTDAFASVKVNGVEVVGMVANPISLENASYALSSWGCIPTVKGIEWANSDLGGDWKGSNHTVKYEDGAIVHTSNILDPNTIAYTGSETCETANTFTFSFRPNERYNFDLAYAGFYLQQPNGNKLLFCFINHWKLLRIFHYNPNETIIAEARYLSEEDYTPGWNAYDEWYDVEITFTDSFVSVKVNGMNVASIVDHGFDTANAKFGMSSWACAPSVKDMAFDKKTIEHDFKGSFSEALENGEKVYTAKSSDVNRMWYTDNTITDSVNTVSYYFRANSSYLGHDTAHASFYLKGTNGEELSFTFMNHWKLLRLINWKPEETWLGGEGVRYEKEINYTPGWNNYDQWYKVEITFTEEVLIVKVNGEEIASVVAHNFEIDGAYIGFASWGCAPSFKNIELSKVTVDMSNYRWAGTNFNKVYEDGEINYLSTGDIYQLQKLYYADTTGSANTISYKVKFLEDETFGEPERNVAMNVFSSNKENTQVAFQVMPHWNATRIQIFEGSNGTILTADNYEPTEWMEIKVVFAKNYLAQYVNGKLIAVSYNSMWNSFENVNVNLSVWGTIVQVKDIQFSTTVIAPEQLWYGSSFEITEEDGETVYTSIHNGGVNTLGYAGTTEGYNSIEFDLRPGTIGSQRERNAGVAIYNNGSSEHLFFELMPHIKEARVRLFGGSGTAFAVSAGYAAASNSWIHVQCVFTNDYLAMFVNGKLVLSYFDIEGYNFTDTMIVASAWDTAASYKNFTFGNASYSYSDLGYMDLDFLDERSLDSLRSTNATVEYKKATDEIEVTVTGIDPILGITVNQPVGGLYSAYLPLRNTLLVRMANATNANTVEIRFKNSFSQTVHTRTFEIKPNSGYETYMFNLSAGKGMTSYLRDIEIVFVGADSGSIVIDAISFEREEDLSYEYAATQLNCVANAQTNTVTVTGKVLPQYAGMVVTLMETSAVNFAEDVNHVDNKVLATARALEDGTFTIEIPFYREDGTATHLSTIFMATVSTIKLGKTFQIENYQDFITNPYAFTIPDYIVKVTDAPFNAKGDGFTNDNAAIQAAIDAVYAAGGGVVVLPGDDSLYGRRYIATNIELRSNVELRIEKGAVLWQSPRISDYGYDPLIGHDYVTDVMWPHACNVNRPLILVRAVENVRISGGGTIRMLDHGGEDENPWDLIDPNHGASCGNLIHIAPLYVVSSHNVEIRDIKILRTNNWNVTTLYTTNLCVMNVTFAESNCKNGDGIGMCNVTNAYIARNRMFGTDDAFTLNANGGDPRWGDDWGKPVDNSHASTTNIEIAHNNMRGGLGLVFITWGTHREDLSQALIKNIVCYDNVFAGFGQDIGSWPDNPFYGWSSNDDYALGSGEVDDYSPVQEVYMFDNAYTNGVAILGWQGDVIEAESTMFITDAEYKTSSYFVNASFERNLRYDNEVTWLSGLSYWTNITENGGSVGIEARGTKQAVAKYTQNEHTVTDYAGYIDGDGKLYQGLWLNKGLYVMVATVKNVAGNAQLFVGSPLIKKHVSDANAVSVIKQQTIEVGNDYAIVTFTFFVEENGVYAVGITHQGAVGERVYMDDFAVARDYVGELELEERNQAAAVLAGKINLAKSYKAEAYTQETFAVLQSAIESAVATLNDETANTQALNEMVTALENAIEQLEEKPEIPVDSSSTESSSDSSVQLSSCMAALGGSEILIALAMVGLIVIGRKKRNN